MQSTLVFENLLSGLRPYRAHRDKDGRYYIVVGIVEDGGKPRKIYIDGVLSSQQYKNLRKSKRYIKLDEGKVLAKVASKQLLAKRAKEGPSLADKLFKTDKQTISSKKGTKGRSARSSYSTVNNRARDTKNELNAEMKDILKKLQDLMGKQPKTPSEAERVRRSIEQLYQRLYGNQWLYNMMGVSGFVGDDKRTTQKLLENAPSSSPGKPPEKTAALGRKEMDDIAIYRATTRSPTEFNDRRDIASKAAFATAESIIGLLRDENTRRNVLDKVVIEDDKLRSNRNLLRQRRIDYTMRRFPGIFDQFRQYAIDGTPDEFGIIQAIVDNPNKTSSFTKIRTNVTDRIIKRGGIKDETVERVLFGTTVRDDPVLSFLRKDETLEMAPDARERIAKQRDIEAEEEFMDEFRAEVPIISATVGLEEGDPVVLERVMPAEYHGDIPELKIPAMTEKGPTEKKITTMADNLKSTSIVKIPQTAKSADKPPTTKIPAPSKTTKSGPIDKPTESKIPTPSKTITSTQQSSRPAYYLPIKRPDSPEIKQPTVPPKKDAPPAKQQVTSEERAILDDVMSKIVEPKSVSKSKEEEELFDYFTKMEDKPPRKEYIDQLQDLYDYWVTIQSYARARGGPSKLTDEELEDFIIQGTGRLSKLPGLSDDEILNIMDKFDIPEFAGVYTVDEFATQMDVGVPICFIMNTERARDFERDPRHVGHWVAVSIIDDAIEYYDPLADPASDAFLQEMDKYMDKLDPDVYYRLKENSVKMQDDSTDNCGWFCILQLVKRFIRGESWAKSTGFIETIQDESEEGEREISRFKSKYSKFL